MSKSYDSRIFEMLSNYRAIAKQVKEIVRKFDPKAKVYVFGSIVRGRYTGASDIDIMVVTERVDLKYEIMIEVYRSIEAPVELHVITKEHLEKWYRKFIKPNEIEEV